jgi:perosamine synthetase
MTELSAALGFSQLARIEEMLAMRDSVARSYRDRIDGMNGARLIEATAGTSRLSWFAAVVRLDERYDRARIIETLAQSGVPAKAYFEPIHLQPHYRRTFGYAPGDFPISERVARTTLALPFHNRLSSDDVDYVCKALEVALDLSAG